MVLFQRLASPLTAEIKGNNLDAFEELPQIDWVPFVVDQSQPSQKRIGMLVLRGRR